MAADNLLLGRIIGTRKMLETLSEDKRFSLITRWKTKRTIKLMEAIEAEYVHIREKEKR